MKKNGPIAITGLGCICAAGAQVAECAASLFEGKRNVRPPSRFKSHHPITYPVFEVPDEFLPKKLRKRADLHLTSKLAVGAAYEAIEHAGLSIGQLEKKRVGVCVGTTVGSSMNNEEFYRAFRSGGNPDMAPITRYLGSNPVSAIAREFLLKGPCQTVVNACSSGTDAIGIGLSWIRSGICDIVVAGGTDELSHVTYNGFISLMITDDSPCKPFDRYRKGLNLGEGAGILVLESESSYQERKGRVLSYLLGYGASTDAYHLTAPHPNGEGLRRALKEVITSCHVQSEEISFVNAHGTGTSDNDRVESNILNELLPGVLFLSTKGYTGHTLGAAGAIEAVLTVVCLEMGKIPANAGFSVRDPDLPGSPVEKTTAFKGNIALSQSLAFGGSNGVLLFKRG
jgi:3-oxoacyl-[acyl-carrier-protein] synthase II